MRAPYQVKGIRDLFPAGRWSVDMFAMFHCGRLDILPVGDLGVRKGFQALYKLKVCVTPYASAPVPYILSALQRVNCSCSLHVVMSHIRRRYALQAIPTDEQMEQIAENWRPYRSLGSAICILQYTDESLPGGTLCGLMPEASVH